MFTLVSKMGTWGPGVLPGKKRTLQPGCGQLTDSNLGPYLAPSAIDFVQHVSFLFCTQQTFPSTDANIPWS